MRSYAQETGVIKVGTLAKISRLYFRDKQSIKEICRQTGIARNTVSTWLREPGRVEPKYPVRVVSHWPLMNVFWALTNASFSSGTDLSCQRIKLVCKRQLAAALQHQLTFANHVHQFDASQDTSGGPK